MMKFYVIAVRMAYTKCPETNYTSENPVENRPLFSIGNIPCLKNSKKTY